jgi:hypothetical protein
MLSRGDSGSLMANPPGPCRSRISTFSAIMQHAMQSSRKSSTGLFHTLNAEATQAGEGVFNTCANVRYLAVDFYATVVVNRYFAFVERSNYERRTLEHAVGETFTVMSLEEVFKKHVNSACVIVHRFLVKGTSVHKKTGTRHDSDDLSNVSGVLWLIEGFRLSDVVDLDWRSIDEIFYAWEPGIYGVSGMRNENLRVIQELGAGTRDHLCGFFERGAPCL